MIYVVVILGALLGLTGWLYKGALESKAEVTGHYEAFKENTRIAGRKALKELDDEIKRQKKVSDASIKSLEARAAASRARADGVCKSAGLSAGCRELPAIPDTARPADDTTRNQRLLEVLRHAQDVADKLIELQEFNRQAVK